MATRNFKSKSTVKLQSNTFNRTRELYAGTHTKTMIDDLVLLDTISEENVVDTLKRRYEKENMYTYIGPVLIAVNPYKMLEKKGKSIYDAEVMSVYKKFDYVEVAPHIFSIAASAYKDLVANGTNQCIIVTGESGAGKTEASKQLMQYMTKAQSLAAYAGTEEAQPQNSRSAIVTEQLLASNPVLEAFGNAQTVRNDNSSRFGKYMELQFDATGTVVGGKITNYLPEKSRVVGQQAGERNFHVFHQLLAGASGAQQSKLGLEGSPSFRYLMGERRTIPKVDDAKEFALLTKKLGVVGVSAGKQAEVFSLLAAILWLGNIEWTEEHCNSGVTVAKPKDPKAIAMVASLLGSDPQSVEMALTSHTIGGGNARMSTKMKKLDAAGATDSRDTLAKAIYSHLFTWLVQTLNQSTAVSSAGYQRVVGILDIYGFEIFENNSFEQFCINYVNEQLQQYFIELTLKAEQEEYAAEGIEWKKIEYFNNQVVLDLISGRHAMMALLDDQNKSRDSTARGLVSSYSRAFSNHAHYTGPKAGKDPMVFGVKHYAGEVTYNAKLFLQKNADTLFSDLSALMTSSSIPLAKELFLDRRSDREKAKRPPTVSFQFKQQVTALMEALRKCRPNYVRCIKPNEVKKPGVFDHARNLHQVRYLGLTENVRVRRAGFCYREPVAIFLNKYKPASTTMWPNPPKGLSASQAVKMMLTDGSLDEGFKLVEGEDFKVGRTKVFVRKPTVLFKLQQMREAHMTRLTLLVQEGVRAHLVWCRAAIMCQKRFRGNHDRRNLSPSAKKLALKWVEKRRRQGKKNRKWYARPPYPPPGGGRDAEPRERKVSAVNKSFKGVMAFWQS